MRPIVTMMVLALGAAPALAGTKAVYDQEGKGPLIVEIADNGDMRVGPDDGEMYGLMLGDTFYVVGTEEGKISVARLQDVATAFDTALPPIFGQLFGAAARATPAHPARIENLGPRTVNGRPGVAYRLSSSGSDGMSAELVVSTDPALAPVGRAMGRFTEATMVMLRPLFGAATAGMVTDMRAVFALGTPLSSKRGLTLKSVETADVPAARLALPAKPQTVEEIIAELKVNKPAE